jgi:hypothetical protein
MRENPRTARCGVKGLSVRHDRRERDRRNPARAWWHHSGGEPGQQPDVAFRQRLVDDRPEQERGGDGHDGRGDIDVLARATITIAHRLSTVRNADQIAVLDHGKSGTVDLYPAARPTSQNAPGSERGSPHGECQLDRTSPSASMT